MSSLITQDTEHQPLREFAEKAYLNYSMYVILDRALPHIEDGLKPVQRRIIYAMSELGLSAAAKYKKSARTVGDVLGKFHPHGDSACYEAMVLMAQPFSYRYPFVDGQGNWGSSDDPKSFAAMRYTEARLSPYTQLMLAELHQGTVAWQPNFDGTLNEPRLLPARVPNILLNGSMGIAVGMATDIPPHNMAEVVNACIHLLKNPNSTLDDICNIILAPDYPTAAEIITPRDEIIEMYRKGNGSVKQRAVYHLEDNDIVITQLPHQVAGSKVLEQIAAQMQAKKLPMIADLRDESDHEHPTRLLIIPRSSRVDVTAIMDHLFATTDLQRSYRINFNMIGINGKPHVKNLLQILKEWLTFRLATIHRRLQYRLDQIENRLEVLTALLIVYLNLDEVIAIIRQEDEPKPVLIQRFKLTDVQVNAILDTKLRHLAKLEEMKIRDEQTTLEKEKNELQKILASESLLKKTLRDEMEKDLKTFGDTRRSPLIERADAQALSESDRLPNEPVTVVLSDKDWIRVGKGHDIDGNNLSYRAGDQFKMQTLGKSLQPLLLLDSTGRSYTLSPNQLPSARGQGEPLTGHLSPPAGAHFIGILLTENTQTLLLASNHGYGFITTAEQLICKNKKGKALLNVGTHTALPPLLCSNIDTDFIAIATSEGYLLVITANNIPQLNKGKGNKLIQIGKNKSATITHLQSFSEKQTLKIIAGKRQLTLKPSDWKAYVGERARRGKLLPKGFTQITQMIAE